MKKKGSSLKKRLNMLLLVCLLPLGIMIVYLLITVNRFSERYDAIVANITMANAYNIDFKEDIDYIMYIIVVNSERADDLVDTKQPHVQIQEAREVFENLYELADEEYPKSQLDRILKSLDTLEVRVEEIERDAKVTGSYEKNMERLDLNIHILTELIQEQIQKYIYYEATNLEALREAIRLDVNRAIQMVSVIFIVILTLALLISRKIMTGITEPIRSLCEVTRVAGSGDFEVRAEKETDDELAILGSSFNQMVEQIGELVEGIRVEQMNLKAAELKLLQAQINPHFLYNTLDAIIWLAESGEKEQVVKMVTSLSSFFRTTLSKGQDYISVEEERTHIKSYLQIQRFRYQDILEYEIRIPEELYEYRILKMTLQPLVENALYHGIKNKRRVGHIIVTGERVDETLMFKVRDDGVGLDEERLAYVRELIRDGSSKTPGRGKNDASNGSGRTNGDGGSSSDGDASSASGSGFGLFNVAQRIRLNYGEEYGLSIDSIYGEGTEIEVIIPAEKN